MIGSELYFSLFVGVILSLIFAEKFGINPAGLVVPGYLALIFDQPIMLLSVLIISCLTYFIVNNGISKWVILYGRRKFAAMILTGMVLKFIFDLIYPLTPFEMVEVSGIGVVIPGIIANTVQKQGVVITLSTTMLLTCIMSSCSYIALSTNHEQGARINEKEKRLSPSEWLLKQSKRHKRRNTLYTAIVLYQL